MILIELWKVDGEYIDKGYLRNNTKGELYANRLNRKRNHKLL